MTHAARASLPPDPPLRLRAGRRDGASRSDQGAKADAAPPAAELSVLAEDSRRRHRFPDTGGTRGWLRQGRRGGGADAPPPVRFRRGGGTYATSAGRQSQTPPVPAETGSRGDQSPRLQQS